MEQKKKVEKKNQEKKNEEKKAACVTVLKVLLCLVLAIFLAEALACAGVCVKNGYQAESFVRFAVKSRSIEADELQVNGYQVTEDGTFISQSNDACFITPDLNTKVENVVLSFSEPLANDLGVKVYYDENGQGLNEKNTRVGVAEANTSYLEIPLSKRVINLRIDIGETQSDQFVLDRVMINHFNWLHKDAVYYGIMIFIVLLVFMFWESKTVQFVYKRRYYAAALVCALGILLQLHGASINYWSNIYGASVYDEIPTNVFGTTRAVRGDDWAAFTSMAFSQEYNDYGYLTDRIGIHDKDVSIVYGQPVKSIAGLFRPELWGYILLGSVRGLSFFWIVMMLFAGLLVNPVVRGADAVYENKLLNEVKAEVEAKDELWAFDGVHSYMGTALLTVGAKSLNAIQVYPDLSMWYEIDPDRKYEEVYNRYQHIRLNIVPAGTSFRVLTPDSIEADLCPENLKQLGVEKIVTKQNLEELNDQDVTFAFYKEIGSYKIYQLN